MSYESPPVPERPKLRPPVGIPVPATPRVRSVLASVGIHALIIALLVVPFAAPEVIRVITGSGGPTPAGGGGGGLRGSGGDRGGPPIVERLRYVQLAAPPVPPPTKAAVSAPVVTPPPVVKPPVAPPVTPPVSKPAPAATTTPAPATSSVTAPGAGSGGGTGADGTLGSGPGTGGGVGSGAGSGRGSGVGPATGGGTTANPAPTLVEMFIPPPGTPKRDKGKTIVAVFDVDSTGHVIKVDFTQVSDGGYNRKLREAFESFRFRPAVRPDGTPIRATASVEYVL